MESLDLVQLRVIRHSLCIQQKLNLKIVKHYTWMLYRYVLCYALILLVISIWEHPSKIFLYILVDFNWGFRSFFMPAMMLIIKCTKKFMIKTIKWTNEIIINFWQTSLVCVPFDVICLLPLHLQLALIFNQLQMEYLIIVGMLLMIVTTTMLFLKLRVIFEDH